MGHCERCGGTIQADRWGGFRGHSEDQCIQALQTALTAEREARLKAEQERDAALDMAWRTVDALGGTFDRSDPRAYGYDEALGNACEAISKLGGMDPLERKRLHARMEKP